MAQEKGFVTENLESVMKIQLVNGSEIECVIDTGFNGFLLLPRKFIEDNSMRFVGIESVTMVEQNTTEIEVASGIINWLGKRLSVRILVSETGESLIGTEMLIGTILEIDYINSTVKITKPS
jgi:clan AA aspartic protease